MDIAWAVLITVAAVGVAVAAILLVRRRAPDGGYFNDGDRAAGVFGVLATGFAVLLGFIVFLAFTSYDESKTGAETEALVVVQQFETAQFLPPAARRQLGGELVCYGRSVVGQEWPRMEAGSEKGAINPWGLACSGPCGPSSPRPRPSSPPTTSGSTRRSRARRPAATASTPPTASFPCPCGGCCSSSLGSSSCTCSFCRQR